MLEKIETVRENAQKSFAESYGKPWNELLDTWYPFFVGYLGSRWQAEYETQQAQLEYEETKHLPDPAEKSSKR